MTIKAPVLSEILSDFRIVEERRTNIKENYHIFFLNRDIENCNLDSG